MTYASRIYQNRDYFDLALGKHQYMHTPRCAGPTLEWNKHISDLFSECWTSYTTNM